jgi:hypothetical protein
MTAGSKDKRGIGRVLGVFILLAGAAIALGLPSAGAAGLPDITFISEGGVVSGVYILNVSVTGDVNTSEVFYWVDSATPTSMTPTSGPYYEGDIDTTGLVDGEHTAYVQAYNTSGLYKIVEQKLTTDNTMPEITIMSEGGFASGKYSFLANVTDANLDEGNVHAILDGNMMDKRLMTKVGDDFEYELNTTLLADGSHTLSVYAMDLAKPSNTNASEVLEIKVDNNAPSVSVTSEVPEFVMGDYTITANVTDTYLNASHVWVVLDDNMSDPRSMVLEGSEYTYTIDTTSDLVCGDHTFKLWVTDLAGHETVTEAVVMQVDNCPPMVYITSEVGYVMGLYKLTAEVSDAYLNASAVWVVFDDDEQNKDAMLHEGGTTFSFSFHTGTIPDGDLSIYVMTVDLAGHSNSSEVAVLMVDNNPPHVEVTSEGGPVSGVYIFKGVAEDPYINASAVYALIDDDQVNATMMVWAGAAYQAAIDTTMLEDGEHTFRVWAFDLSGNSNMSEAIAVDVDNNPPMVHILSEMGLKWGNFRFMVNVTDPHLNESCVKIKVGDADPVQLTNRGEYWDYTIDTTALPNGEVMIMVMACDLRDNLNSMESLMITVENRADLVIVNVEYDKTKIEEGKTLKVQVTVKNQGYAAAGGFDIELRAEGKIVDNTTVDEPLARNEEKVYLLEWKADKTGKKALFVVVDPDGAVAEMDDTNNEGSQETIEVTEESPGFGTLLVLGAVVLAAVAMRRRR